MKRQNYVAILLMVMMAFALAGCGMKKSKDNAEATTGWSVANPDNTTKNVYNHMDTSSHIDKLCHLGSPVTPSLRRACRVPRHDITNHCTKEYLYTFVIFYILFVHIARIKKQPYSV